MSDIEVTEEHSSEVGRFYLAEPLGAATEEIGGLPAPRTYPLRTDTGGTAALVTLFEWNADALRTQLAKGGSADADALRAQRDGYADSWEAEKARADRAEVSLTEVRQKLSLARQVNDDLIAKLEAAEARARLEGRHREHAEIERNDAEGRLAEVRGALAEIDVKLHELREEYRAEAIRQAARRDSEHGLRQGLVLSVERLSGRAASAEMMLVASESEAFSLRRKVAKIKRRLKAARSARDAVIRAHAPAPSRPLLEPYQTGIHDQWAVDLPPSGYPEGSLARGGTLYFPPVASKADVDSFVSHWQTKVEAPEAEEAEPRKGKCAVCRNTGWVGAQRFDSPLHHHCSICSADCASHTQERVRRAAAEAAEHAGREGLS